ncbi:MAG TPA: hypothetical protein VHO67_03625 [Polyangia bacterium]|nr:hypothetical protein [Polyangia bacterium]
MRNGPSSKTIAFVGFLWAATVGCGKSDGNSPGAAGSNGSPGSGGVASGGTGGGGRTGQAASGGATGSGGTSASGGVTGSAGSAGGSTGTAGHLGTGGQSATGGQPGTGGQAGRGSGGGAPEGGASGGSGQGGAANQRSISFGTLLDAQAVMAAAQQLAKSAATPGSAQWRAKGDQHRKYHFAAAGADEPYRLYVPTNWDGTSSLPLAMFLHGAGADESTYVDQNNKQMLTLAQQHGYLLVAPLGDKGAYGNFLRLSSPFGKPDEAAKLMAQVTAADERTNELSEQDVINVLELVLAEYPIDRSAMFLFGHSMGSGGTWYIGGKYAAYWTGLAPMSGPFVQETGYPWDALRNTFIFVTEGTQAPSVDGSHLLRDWLKTNGFKSEYEEVNADHPGMVPLVLPDVFDFFDRS